MKLATFILSCTLMCKIAYSAPERSAIFQFKSSVDLNLLKLKSKFETNKLDFGLTPLQAREIFQLSKGEADFRNIYSINLDNQSLRAAQIENFNGFSGVTNSNIPPPSTSFADPELKEEWWINKLNAGQAWRLASGNGITIADCDAGFRINEPDISNNLLMNFAQDFADLDNPRKIDDGGNLTHGTAVVSILAGILNGSGTSGIAYNAKVVPLQNYNYDKGLDDINKEEATAKCILGAVRIPSVNIILLENQTENGSSETFSGTRSAVKLAIKSGITIISAAGNFNKYLLIEEKFNTSSIIVGALNRSGHKKSDSNYGSRITVSGFGEGIRTLGGPNGKIIVFNQTSAAAPQVAATAAMMLERNPKLTPKDIKDIFILTRRVTKYNKMVGGQLDIGAAVKMSVDYTPFGNITDGQIFRSQLTEILKRN